MQTVADIRALLQEAGAEEFAVLERAFKADTRKGVVQALQAARKRLEAQAAEQRRVEALYRYEEEIASGGVVIGLDEVGRGPLAGPLTIGGVVLARSPLLLGLNDSKQVPAPRREVLASQVRETAIAWTIQHVPPQEIDELGMAACLRKGFTAAIAAIEAQGVHVDVILLDGNPLHMDAREVNVVKGDAKCASIAAASIIAKVERDDLMVQAAEMYPYYGFDHNKGYGSAAHMKAISTHGLSPIHRRSFCQFYEQQTLF